MPYFHELGDPDRQVAEWRRIHADKHERGLRFGGAQKPWPKCAICRREAQGDVVSVVVPDEEGRRDG